ncbi:MAG: hypothetical protein Q4D23_03465 [Bacteroidales bacterium]|nr:hypothetical protein [Bacteroidales bacterium]
MKKVVLLAGVVAAGMAAAPVAANAAAPKNPEVLNLTTGDAPYQDYEHYYSVLAARHTALELMKQDIINGDKAPYNTFTQAALTAVLADVEKQINDLDALQFAIKSLYDAMNVTDQQNKDYSTSAWEKAVDDAIDYITSKVTADEFDNLLDTYIEFADQMKTWEDFYTWYNVDYDGDGLATDGYKTYITNRQTTTDYKKVNETGDVAGQIHQVNTGSNAFGVLLGTAPELKDGGIINEMTVTKKTNLDISKNDLVAKQQALDALVARYHSDQANLTSATVDGSYTKVATDFVSKATATKVNEGEFLLDATDPNSYSHKYAYAIAVKLIKAAGAINVAGNFIETFAASDPSETGWKATFTGEGTGKTGEYEGFATEAEYLQQAQQYIQDILDIEAEYDALVAAARANVAAAKALREAEALRQGEMNEAFQTNKTKTVDGADVSYWNRNTERFVLGAMPALESSVEDAAGYYNYRWHIRDLQAKLNNVIAAYDLDRTKDVTDIHDQIWIWFDEGTADNEHDAVQYKTNMTVNDVVLGQMKTDIETLAAKMKDNEDANNTLHELEALLETHVADMYTTCVGYDDIDAADFANGGQFWSSGDCEDNRHYNGYCRLRRDVIGGFKQAEVTAYDSFDPADDTKGAKAFLEGAAPALDKAAHEAIELIWNHVATVQCNAHLADVNTKMETEFANAKALDTVCKDAADVWDWSVAPEDQECKCAENDTTMNPCGWCDPAVKAQLDAIRAAYNTNVNDLDAAHAGDGSTATVTYVDAATLFPGVGTAKGLVAAFKAYEEATAGTDGTIDTWYAAFEAADAAHDAKLKEQWEEANDRIHEYIHEVAGQVSFDIVNFDKGDTAVADKWAQALKDSTFKVYNGEGQEELVLGVDFDLDGTTDEFASFQAFYEAIKAADALYTAEAKKLYDEHKWTELKQLSEKVLGIHGVDTYKQAVETNRTARIVLETQLAEKQAELEAERNAVDAAKVYSSVTNPSGKDDYTALTDDVVVDDTYDTDLKKALKALADEAKAIETAYNNGKAGAYTEDGEAKEGYALNATAVDAAIAAYVAAVDAAEQLYRENKRCLDKYTEEFKTVLATKLGIDTVLENADVYTAFAADGDDAADVTKLTKTGIVAAALAAYNTAYAADYAHLAQFKTGELWANEVAHDGHIVALTALVKDYEDAVLKAVKLYADNVQARDAKTAEIGDLQNELDAILVDAHKLYGTGDTVNAADKANEYGPLTGTVNSIQEAINDAKRDLAKAFAAGTAPAYTVPATIATSIDALRQAVMDAEYFKAQNEKNYVTLREEVTNLVTAVESLKLDVDMYGQIENGTAEHPEYAAVNEYDRESIENVLFGYVDEDGNPVKGLKENLEDLLTALETACGNGTLYTDAQVNAQQAKINALVSEFEALKVQVDIAENIYAENAKALVRLQSQAQTIHALLDTAKANCVCSACNNEDNNELGDEFATLNEIKNNFQNSFEVAELVDLVTLNFVNDETHYRNQLESLEARVRETLDKIQEHKLRQLRDQDAYNMLQKALLDVDLWLANVQAEDGWENFAVRGAHAEATMCNGATSNPNVKYLNELTNNVNDLKLLIEAQHTHAGWDVDYDKGIVGLGHVCEENKIDDIKAMKALIEDAKTLIAAIQANEAAHELIIARFDELKDDALAAYKFWHQYYSEQTLTDPAYNWNIANQNWIKDVDGTLENGDYLITIQNYLHDSYVHGSAAYTWTVDAKGEELNGDANTFFGGYDQTLAHDRNYLAHEEAVNHYNQVALAITDYKALTEAEYSSEVDGVTSWDPFVRKWEDGKFVGVYEDWSEEVEGENGLIAALNLYKEDIEAAYAEGVMEDAINIDEHNRAQGIHQQLNNLAGLLETIKAEYAALFEAAHHLTNGKTVYSDQEYFTLGFFQKANDGLGFQGQEMFNTVVVNDMDKINVLDLTAYESEDVYEDPTDFNSPCTTTYATDEDGNLIRWNDGYATDVQVLVNGNKQNELTFNIPQPTAPLAVTTLLAGPADIEFLPEAITVDEWLTRHNVYISFNVAEPVVEENQDVDAAASSSKLIVRVANPVDLTYTSKVLVATTNNGDQFSFADATFNTAKGQIEFELPEGTESVVLPEGFFTFRTGENTIARSAACTVVVAGATSIEGLIAMGEKAQIFDLQGRRVKAEALISGNTYVVNGEKVMVK